MLALGWVYLRNGHVRIDIVRSRWSGRHRATVTTVARAQLNKVERRLKRLTALKRELESMVRQCAGGAMSDCRIVEALADYPSNGAGPPPTG
jgi:hypothetical protein